MPRYEVNVPFAGYFTGEVEADSPAKAIDKAMEQCSYRVVVDDGCGFEIAEVETLSHVSRGNVNHAPLCSATAEPIY